MPNQNRPSEKMGFLAYWEYRNIGKINYRKLNKSGFSLIELVVVIAILAILSAIALPLFSGVRKDAQINQAKNAMASLVKECLVAITRKPDTNADMNSMATAKASLSGYELISLNSQAQGLGSCVKNENSSRVRGKYITLEALPTEYDSTLGHRVSEMPSFLIEYNLNTGETEKTCYKENTTKYGGDSFEGGGCKQNTTPTLIGGGIGGRPELWGPADPQGKWD